MTPQEKKKLRKDATWSGAYTKDGKKIMFASQNKVEELKEYIQKVLEILGHPEAWVSDLSSVGDFICYLDTKKEQNAKLRVFGKRLGFKVKIGDLVWEVAQRLKESEKHGRAARPKVNRTKTSNRSKKRS